MKNKIGVYRFLYYLLVLVAFVAFFALSSLMLSAVSARNDKAELGEIMFAINALLYVGVPIFAVAAARFSLLPWYVDPFAAAIPPLTLYGWTIVNKVHMCGDFSKAVTDVTESLLRDGGKGMIFYVALFALGLAASFSLARKRGESVSYRILMQP